jgi:hypothetical protein
MVPVGVLLALLLAPEIVETKVDPGGKMSFDYGRPTWHEELDTWFEKDVSWRFGANNPTVWKTDAGLIFGDVVVFPGAYNVGAVRYKDQPGRWLVVFHHDGFVYNGATNSGQVWAEETTVAEKEAAQRFTVEFDPADRSAGAAKGSYVLRATFGARRMELPFRTAAAKTLKGKVGKTPFTATYLERTDLEELAAQIAKGPVGVAQIESKKLEHPVRLLLDASTGTPKLLVADRNGADPLAPSSTIDGQAGDAPQAKETKEMRLTIDTTAERTLLRFDVAGKRYDFELPEAAVSTPAGRTG